MDFSGKVALVTGGSSGIGKATAIQFAEHGAKVVVAARREQEGLETVELIREGGREALFVRTDVALEPNVMKMVGAATSTFGRLDYAINNASIEGNLKPTSDTLEEEWDMVSNVNLKGMFLCIKHEADAIISGNDGGAIVNVGSVNSRLGFAGGMAYVATKHGQIGLTRCAAAEYAAHGIRVNIVCPGVIQTDMNQRLRGVVGDEIYDDYLIAQRTPMARMGTAEEIARTILVLCSDDTSFVTGAVLYADGGLTAT
jgi:NAD(P)-dependent dehydrogenase (short-subunit alcohol dehydrogenase family)